MPLPLRALAVSLIFGFTVLAGPAVADVLPPLDLSLLLLQRLAAQEKTGNAALSPYSVENILGMLEEGADWTTRKTLDQSLGIDGEAGFARYHEARKQSRLDLLGKHDEVRLDIADALWVSPELQVKPDFTTALTTAYDAKIATIDFGSEQALPEINGWVKAKTGGAIDGIIQELPRDTGFVLADALYFKAAWSVPFDPAETAATPFKPESGAPHPVASMKRKGDYAYWEGSFGQAVRLDYADPRFFMAVLLPSAKAPKMLIDRGLLTGLFNPEKFAHREGTLALPRFRLDTSFRLEKMLAENGFSQLFGNDSHFGQLSQNPFRIDAVIHRVAMVVEEHGTEASAATAVLSTRSLLGPPPFSMICDRPFFIVVGDTKTGAALFLAKIGDPAP